MDEVGFDGQNKRQTVHNVMNCFFCLKDKPNCSGYVLRLKPDAALSSHKILKQYENRTFAMCEECKRKSEEEIAKIIVGYILSEREVERLSNKIRKKR